jgi:twitching motility two-component system response regulator PilG
MSDTFGHLNPGKNKGGNIPVDMAGVKASGPPQNTSLENAGTATAKAMSDSASGVPGGERRRRRRALISMPVRVRGADVIEGGPDEISNTLDVSRNGFLFTTAQSTFGVGMIVGVTFPYAELPGAAQAEQEGRVARVTEILDGRWSVAVVFGVGVGENIVDTAGCNLLAKAAPGAAEQAPERPLVIVVDGDSIIRDTLEIYLTNDGYEVITLCYAAEAYRTLDMFTPALLIAAIEGEDRPGYELCAHVKSTPRLNTVPVMLLTSSAYPSDYANAHSLGAVVCMAKPYRQERLGHVVRLLAPTQQAKDGTAPVRPADKSRRGCRVKKHSQALNPVQSRRDSSWQW